MAACTRVLGDNKYAVAVGSLHGDLTFEEERMVIGDPLNQTVCCSCGMFNRAGILCAHGLKVLDLMNIKMLPTHYILKRWTREARTANIQDRQGRKVIENPKLEAQLRFKSMSLKFHNLTYKATDSLECCLLIDNALDCLCTQVQDKLNVSSCAMNEKSTNEQENDDPNVNQRDDLFRAAKLKKKEVESKKNRRERRVGWINFDTS
jgi:zinc finger SWIM domain-containing protein 3